MAEAAADPREPRRTRRWITYVLALLAAFAVYAAPLPELPLVRLVLEEFTGAVSAGEVELERPVPVAIVNFALEPGPCTAQSSAIGRTSFACVAQVLDQANAAGARLAVIDLYIPARSAHATPVSAADATLIAAIQRSRIPVVILRQPTHDGDGINRPLRLVPNIFDDVRAAHLERAASLLHAEREGLNRYAEGYRTASGAFIPSVPFAVHRLLKPEARPRRILTGDKRPLRATTLPIAGRAGSSPPRRGPRGRHRRSPARSGRPARVARPGLADRQRLSRGSERPGQRPPSGQRRRLGFRPGADGPRRERR